MNDKNDLKDIEDVISEIQSVLNMQKSDIDHNEVKTRQHRQL